jgi:hypothetical protein
LNVQGVRISRRARKRVLDRQVPTRSTRSGHTTIAAFVVICAGGSYMLHGSRAAA